MTYLQRNCDPRQSHFSVADMSASKRPFMRPWVSLWVVGCGLFTAMSGKANYELDLQAILNTQGLAQAVAIGDVTGDGLHDMVVVNNGYGGDFNNHVLIYAGTENGALAAPAALAYGDHISGDRGLVLINVDDDDALEVVIGHHRQLAVVNQSNGLEFVIEQIITRDTNHVLGAIDVNADGRAELVSMPVRGTFKPAVFYDVVNWQVMIEVDLSAYGGQFELAVTDLGTDGNEDLLLVNKGSSAFSDLIVLRADGSGGFLPPQTHSLGINNEIASGLAVGDFNADGSVDALVTSGLDLEAALFLADEFGDLWQDTGVPVTGPAELAEAHDLSRNGLSDVALIHQSSNQQLPAIGVLLQQSMGFQAEQLLTLPAPLIYRMQDIALGDVNNDGCGDVLVADHNQGLLVLNGQGCQSGADLGMQVKLRNNRLVITATHFEGLPVNQAAVIVEIATPYGVRFTSTACDMQLIRPGLIQAHCEVGSLAAGTDQRLQLWADTSALPNGLTDLTVTAVINSEWPDPNLSNNTAVFQTH